MNILRLDITQYTYIYHEIIRELYDMCINPRGNTSPQLATEKLRKHSTNVIKTATVTNYLQPVLRSEFYVYLTTKAWNKTLTSFNGRRETRRKFHVVLILDNQ